MRETATPGSNLVALADAVYAGVAANPAEFRDQARDLVVRARREGLAEALVVALRASAWSERLAQHNTVALRLLGEAAALAELHGLDRRLGDLLVTRAAVHQDLGQFGAAQIDVDRALRLLPAGERTELLLQQGVLYQNVGRLREAADHYRLVLEHTECSALVRAKAANNLGYIESELGRSDVARSYLEAAWDWARLAGPAVQAPVAQTRAWIEMHAGRLTDSLALSDEAMRLYAQAGLPIGEPLVEYADALADLRLLPEALAAAEAGLAALPADEVTLMAGEALLRVARLLLLVGDTAAARIRARECAEMLEWQGRRGWLARARVVELETWARDGALTVGQVRDVHRLAAELERCALRGDAVEAYLLAGRCAIDAGRPDAAAADLRSVDRLSRGAPVLVRLRGRVAAALLGEAEGSPSAVLNAAHAGLRDLERHRSALPTMELRALASAHGAELGTLALRAIRPSRSAERTFQWLERTRGAALAPLAAAGSDEDRAADEMSELRILYGELAQARADVGAEPASLLTRIADAESAVRRASWSASPTGAQGPGGTVPHVRRPPGVGDVRERLRAGAAEVLVEYGEVDGQLLAVVVDGSRSRLVEIGPVEGLSRVIDSALFALRRLARPVTSGAAADGAMRSARRALGLLTDRLITPLGLATTVPLVVVPVGDLQRVPWAAMHDGSTAVVPSAAVWLRTLDSAVAGANSSRRVADDRHVAVIGGPGLDGAAVELRAVAGEHASATVLAAPDSTCAAVSALVAAADIAHFACHGRLRADNPLFSSLLLSDGPLTVHELSRRARSPRLVVLAACESGAQVGFAGGEALGFVSALLAGGSTGVIASSVLVSDEGTRALMVAVHESLAAGATIGHALWSARQHLDTDDPHQFASWCAFDAYGGG